MMSCNVLSPQFFWFRWCRRNIWFVFLICMCVNAGMWFERFVIIVTSIARDFLPSSWGMFHPTWVDYLWTFAGTFGLFLTLVPALYPLPADDRHRGGQGRHAARQRAHRPRWRRLVTRAARPPNPPTCMPAGEGSGTRERATEGDAVPATSEHPAEPIRPDAANQGQSASGR